MIKIKDNNYLYCRESEYRFNETIEIILSKIEEFGFSLQYIHDVKKSLADKGKEIDSLKIIEVCNVKYASQALNQDKLISLMMPCKINVIKNKDSIKVCTLKASSLVSFFPQSDLKSIANEIDQKLRAIVDSSSDKKL